MHALLYCGEESRGGGAAHDLDGRGEHGTRIPPEKDFKSGDGEGGLEKETKRDVARGGVGREGVGQNVPFVVGGSVNNDSAA